MSFRYFLTLVFAATVGLAPDASNAITPSQPLQELCPKTSEVGTNVACYPLTYNVFTKVHPPGNSEFPNGIPIIAFLFVPTDADFSQPLPAIVYGHGSGEMYSSGVHNKGLNNKHKQITRQFTSELGYVTIHFSSFHSRYLLADTTGAQALIIDTPPSDIPGGDDYWSYANVVPDANCTGATDPVDPNCAKWNDQNNGKNGVSEYLERPYDAVGAADFLTGVINGTLLARATGDGSSSRTLASNYDPTLTGTIQQIVDANLRVDPRRVFYAGTSHGGQLSMFAAHEDVANDASHPMGTGVRFSAFFDYYGGCGLYNAVGGWRYSESLWNPVDESPFIMLHGEADPIWHIDTSGATTRDWWYAGECSPRIEKAKVEFGQTGMLEAAVYTGAEHSFDDATSADTYENWAAKLHANYEVQLPLMEALGYISWAERTARTVPTLADFGITSDLAWFSTFPLDGNLPPDLSFVTADVGGNEIVIGDLTAGSIDLDTLISDPYDLYALSYALQGEPAAVSLSASTLSLAFSSSEISAGVDEWFFVTASQGKATLHVPVQVVSTSGNSGVARFHQPLRFFDQTTYQSVVTGGDVRFDLRSLVNTRFRHALNYKPVFGGISLPAGMSLDQDGLLTGAAPASLPASASIDTSINGARVQWTLNIAQGSATDVLIYDIATVDAFDFSGSTGTALAAPDYSEISVTPGEIAGPDSGSNSAPVADAGIDQTATSGDTVTLNGTSSSDPDGDALIYSWSQTAGTTVTLSDTAIAQPAFTAPSVASMTTLTFQLTVTDTHGASHSDSVNISVSPPVNQAPVADAGADQSAETDSEVTLDGSASSDPDGDEFTYSWTQTGGTSVSLSGANTATPTFTAPAGSGALTFELTVTDSHGATGSDTVSVNVHQAPVADAGPNQTVLVNSEVALDGSASSDPDGGALTYSWAQTGGATVTLAGANMATPTFTAPASSGALTFELTVTDSHGATGSDTVTVNVHQAPVANAGADQIVLVGSGVTLNGDGSFDPDGDMLNYSWTQTGGTSVSLSGATTATPTFTAPADPETLAFQLTVTDSHGAPASSSVSVTVHQPPIADAGSAQIVVFGALVTLDGRGSSDPDGTALTYLWTQISGTGVTLNDATSATPEFIAPHASEALTFQLMVTDGLDATAADSVTITIEPPPNQAPIAGAGANQNAVSGDTVTLDGSASSDPDGDSISYHWSQLSGPLVALNDATAAMPGFTAPEVASTSTLTFELTVTDEHGASHSDSVSVAVNPPANQAPVADVGPNQNVASGDYVTLDGSGSSDPDNDALSYAWTQISGPLVTLSDTAAAQPAFIAPTVTSTTTLIFELTVSDPDGAAATDSVSITIDASTSTGTPTANAGSSQNVTAGDIVTLDGSASSDPDGDSLAFAWIQISGPTVTLNGASTANPSFTAPDVASPTTLTFELTVTDTSGASSTDSVTITVSPLPNSAPSANAGPTQNVSSGVNVTLDGSASSDPDGDALSYQWTQIGGPTVALAAADTAEATFVAPTVSTTTALTFELVVTDTHGATASDSVSINVSPVVSGNQPPAADAGANQSVVSGAAVQLDGSASSDPEGDALSYKWQQIDGPVVTLDDPALAQPTFTAPDVTEMAVLVVELTVTDSHNATHTDSVTFTVTPIANQAPVANAGSDQSVIERSNVTLDGRGSSDADADNLGYAWTQISGPMISLQNANSSQPHFTAPDVSETTILAFRLTVNDPHGATDSDEVSVTVNPEQGKGKKKGGGATFWLTPLLLLVLRRRRDIV